MNRVAASCRIFDADATVEITSDYVVSKFSRYSAVFDTRRNGIETTDMQGSFAAGKDSAAFGMNIDYPGRPKSKLRRKRARD